MAWGFIPGSNDLWEFDNAEDQEGIYSDANGTIAAGVRTYVSPFGNVQETYINVRRAGSSFSSGEISKTYYDARISPLASLFSANEPGFAYDYRDISTLFQDVEGTVPVTTAGQTVALVLDKSGNANHATQPAPEFRPTYGVDGSGIGRLAFANSFLITPTISPLTGKVQVFTKVRKLSETTASILGLSNEPFMNAAFELFGPLNGDGYGYLARGTEGSDLSVTGFPPPHIANLSLLIDIETSTSSLKINGATTDGQINLGTGNFGNYPVYIGQRGGFALPFSGEMYSTIVRFGPNLDPSSISAVENSIA